MTAYREYRPHAALAPYVACYWSITSATPLINRVLPDGCMDIVVSDTIEVVGTMRHGMKTASVPLLLNASQPRGGVRLGTAGDLCVGFG